jgi:hypothetical protein
MHARREGRFYRVTFTDGLTVVVPYCDRCERAATRDAARAVKHPALGVTAITPAKPRGTSSATTARDCGREGHSAC